MSAERKAHMDCGDSWKTTIGSGEEVWTSTGKPMTPDQVAETKGVVMLVDNSNAWINGKAVAASRLRLKQASDPRWRLHVGKLFAVVMETIGRNENDHACVRIFGSTPPPADGVWKCMSTSGHRFEVDLTERSTVTNKEKMVDQKFCALMAFDYGVLQRCRKCNMDMDIVESREYVICSGDRDYVSVARGALDYGFRVHIFSFAQALAHDYYRLKESHEDSMTITLLDDFLPTNESELDQIGFTEDAWKLPADSIPLSRTLVFLGCDRIEKIDLIKQFRQELSISTYIYQCDDAIFLIPHYELRNDLLESLFEQAKCAVRGNDEDTGVDVIGMPTFKQRFHKDSLEVKDLEVESPPQASALVEDKESSTMVEAADQWQTVGLGKERAKIRAANTQQSGRQRPRRCRHREFCIMEGCREDGLFVHSDKEMAFFQKRADGKGIKLLKLQNCDRESHKKSQPGSYKDCQFRHQWEPSLCTICLGFVYPDDAKGDDVNAAELCVCKTLPFGRHEKYERELISTKKQEALKRMGYIRQVISTD